MTIMRVKSVIVEEREEERERERESVSESSSNNNDKIMFYVSCSNLLVNFFFRKIEKKVERERARLFLLLLTAKVENMSVKGEESAKVTKIGVKIESERRGRAIWQKEGE